MMLIAFVLSTSTAHDMTKQEEEVTVSSLLLLARLHTVDGPDV